MNRKTLILAIVAAVLVVGVVYVALAQSNANRSPQAADLALSEATATAGTADETGTAELPLTHRQTMAASEIAAEAAASASEDDSGDSTQESADPGSSAKTADDKQTTTKKDPVASKEDDEESEPVALTLEERKDCYWNLIAAEDQAVAEANEKYPFDSDSPDIDAHVKLRLELTEKYQKVVREESGVTAKQAEAILEEGANKAWPMPPLS